MCAVGISALFSFSEAIADDVHFDPKLMIERRLVDAAADSAENCIHGILKANLYRGVRDRDTLVVSAVSLCEPSLKARLASINSAFADKPGLHDLLVDSANRQLQGILAIGE
jgi:hypothetical protein